MMTEILRAAADAGIPRDQVLDRFETVASGLGLGGRTSWTPAEWEAVVAALRDQVSAAQTPGEVLRLQAVVESRFGLDGGAMFGIIPKPLWERSNPADPRNRIEMAARCMVLDLPGHRVLVDAGMGEKWSDKERDIFRVTHPDGGLRANLLAQGIDPDSITDVVLTHLHFDHIGGLTHLNLEGNLVPTLPRATHWVQREQWVWAHHPSARDAGSYRPENFACLGGPNGPPLRLVDGHDRILDAIEVFSLRGHSPGMQGLRVSMQGRTFVFPADLLPTAGHLPLTWVMGYDCHPLTTVQEKHDLLEEAVRHEHILVLCHEPGDAFLQVERTAPDRYRIVARHATAAEAAQAR